MTIDREAAILLAKAELTKLVPTGGYGIDEVGVQELPWGWVVPWNSLAFLATRDVKDTSYGHGPFLVERSTGAVEVTGGGHPPDWYIRRFERRRGYRAWWRWW